VPGPQSVPTDDPRRIAVIMPVIVMTPPQWWHATTAQRNSPDSVTAPILSEVPDF